MKNEGRENKKIRASWLVRCSSAMFDFFLWFFLSAVIFSFIHVDSNILIGISVVAYFAGTVWVEKENEGRSASKILLGFKVETTDGEPPSAKRIITRGILRMIIFPIALLSWRRVTILDYISGIRVIDTSKKRERQKKQDVAGFDESGLKR